jgi:hypothetical protein
LFVNALLVIVAILPFFARSIFSTTETFSATGKSSIRRCCTGIFAAPGGARAKILKARDLIARMPDEGAVRVPRGHCERIINLKN